MDEDIRTLFQVILCLTLANHFTWNLNKLTRYMAFSKCRCLSYILMGTGCFYLSMSPFLVGPTSWGVLSVLTGLTILATRSPELLEPETGTLRIQWTKRDQASLVIGSVILVFALLLAYQILSYLLTQPLF